MMELSEHQKSDPEIERPKILDDLELATAIMIYAIMKNPGGFNFSGLRIPRIIQIWRQGMEVPKIEGFATEIATFQEALYERIATLAQNKRMVQAIWRLNEETRYFREWELRKSDLARDVLDRIAALVNALFTRDKELCCKILLECAERRSSKLMSFDIC